MGVWFKGILRFLGVESGLKAARERVRLLSNKYGWGEDAERKQIGFSPPTGEDLSAGLRGSASRQDDSSSLRLAGFVALGSQPWA